MRLTLADNIKRLARVTESIEKLSNPKIYSNSSYKPAAKCDRSNKRILIQTLKSMKRLVAVIEKQTNEEIQKLFPGFNYNIKNVKS